MNSDERDACLDRLFAQAKDLAPSEQEQLIERDCSDTSLRAELLSLLVAYRDAPKNDFANRLLPEDAVLHSHEAAESIGTEPAEVTSIGRRIGPYKILQVLGEGGMGTVYMAEQTQPVARRVALKLIKPGMDSREVLARFEAERQALSMMDHPNIAKVLDAGSTESGRPYFVMELVKGIPVTKYCDDQKLPTKHRLELFVSICQAVAHAHQKGIIHRDIKPSNVLVAEYDQQAVPKIIDFGVAKATTQKLTEQTLFTRFGQIIGTIEYMSPEQAKLNQLDIDTRSDIYSLGVLLYELLAGTTPFDRKRLRTAALGDMLRIICEEEPPRPSTRLTTQNTVPTIAANRNAEPRALARMLRGELDWIVMRALEKDRTRRYQSAGDFAEDIRRHLSGQAVQACPPSLPYRAKKFMRRYRLLVVVASITLVLVGIFTAAGWLLYRDATIARDKEYTQRIRAESAETEALKAKTAAEQERQKAEEQKEFAEEQYRLARNQLRVSQSMRLAAESRALIQRQPVLSAQLAIEAVRTTHRYDGSVQQPAREALLSATSELGGMPLMGHVGRVSAVRISSDDRWLVTASGDQGPLLWDLTSKNLSVPTCRLPQRKVHRVAISNNRQWVVTGALDGSVRLWPLNVEDPSEAGVELVQFDKWITTLDISNDSRWAVASSYSGEIRAWDLTAEDPASSTIDFESQCEKIIPGTIDLSPDGRRLATVGRDDVVRLWHFASSEHGKLAMEFQHRDPAKQVAFSPDGHWLLTLGDRPRLWNLHADDPTSSSIPLRSQNGRGLSMTRDGRLLAITNSDGNACLYDLTKADPTKSCIVLRGHPTPMTTLLFSRNERWLITGGMDGKVMLWDIEAVSFDSLPTETTADGVESKVWLASDHQDSTYLLTGHDGRISATATTTDGKRLVTGGWGGNIRLWKLDSGHPRANRTIDRPTSVQTIGVSPNGQWLVVGREDASSRLHRLGADDRFDSSIELRGAADGIGSVAISPDSRWVVATSAVPIYIDEPNYARKENVAHVWDLQARDPGERAFQLSGHQAAVTSISISGDGKLVATGGVDGTVRIWDLSAGSGRAIHELDHGASLTFVSISNDGSLVASAAVDGTARLWDITSSPVTRRELVGHLETILKIAISPDNRWMITGGSSEPGRIWDLNSWDSMESQVLPGHESFVVGVAFSPDGRWLATGAWPNCGGGLIIFDLHSLDPFSSPYLQLENMPTSSGFMSFSADSSRMVYAGSPEPTIVDLADGRTRSLPGGAGNFVAIAPDGRRAISAGGNQVQLWDIEIEDLLEYAKRLTGREFTDEEKQQWSMPDDSL